MSHTGWTKSHCWSREASKHSISEKRWSELPGNTLVHQRTVAVAFNVSCKPLVRTAPAHFARLSGRDGPISETREVPLGTVGALVIHHIHESIAKPDQIGEAHRNVDKVVTSCEAVRVQRLRQDVPGARLWQIPEDYCCEARLRSRIATAGTMLAIAITCSCGRGA